MRINARLDQNLEDKIQYILEKRNVSQTEMVKQALELLYELVKSENESSARALIEAGFVGGGKGPSDLSENYKEELGHLLDEKYDNS